MPTENKQTKEKAGVVACRRTASGDVEVLLITARTNPQSWIFPVGTVDPGETLEQAAGRECMEESGYIVEVGSKLGGIELYKGQSIHRFTFFEARVTGEVEDYETDRQRKWAPQSNLLNIVPDVFKPVAYAALAEKK